MSSLALFFIYAITQCMSLVLLKTSVDTLGWSTTSMGRGLFSLLFSLLVIFKSRPTVFLNAPQTFDLKIEVKRFFLGGFGLAIQIFLLKFWSPLVLLIVSRLDTLFLLLRIKNMEFFILTLAVGGGLLSFFFLPAGLALISVSSLMFSQLELKKSALTQRRWITIAPSLGLIVLGLLYSLFNSLLEHIPTQSMPLAEVPLLLMLGALMALLYYLGSELIRKAGFRGYLFSQLFSGVILILLKL